VFWKGAERLLNWDEHPHTQEVRQKAMHQLSGTFYVFLEKSMPNNAAKQLNLSWRILSAVFVLALTLQSKFSLYKICRDFLGACKDIPLVLSTWKKHVTGCLGKNFGGRCDSAVVTAACYWSSSQCSEVCDHFGGVKSQPFTVGVAPFMLEW